MIHIQSMGGGLGNQLFVYAAARSIQLETGESIIAYDRPYDDNVPAAKRTVEQMISSQANIYYKEETHTKSFYKRQFPVRTFIFRVSNKIARLILRAKTPKDIFQVERIMQPFWNRLGFAVVTLGYVPVCRHRTPRNYVMMGYFCSGKFYGTHSEEIRQELCRPDLIPEKSRILLQRIQSCNSVCMHIRLGDYVDPQKHFREKFYVCGPEYYLTAMKKACEELQNPTFFVFTNDVSSASQMEFLCGEDVVFVPEGNTAVEDLQLMGQCKHYILSNSTYSWWGQFLCENREKRVYAPKHWFRTEMPEDYIEEGWVEIDTPFPMI